MSACCGVSQGLTTRSLASCQCLQTAWPIKKPICVVNSSGFCCVQKSQLMKKQLCILGGWIQRPWAPLKKPCCIMVAKPAAGDQLPNNWPLAYLAIEIIGAITSIACQCQSIRLVAGAPAQVPSAHPELRQGKSRFKLAH